MMDSDPFQVSVVTPVYNAEHFVRRAVESAVQLPEVGEIILIDDAGPDDALEICRQLACENPKVKLLQHPDQGNHGAGASRNLGLEYARFEYVAFLDADDYYLPDRFEKERQIFPNDPDVDGVYGAIGVDYESDEARQQFLEAGYGYQEFLTLSGIVPPDELINVLFSSHPNVTGAFSTIAVTVRKSLFERSGLFDEKLRLRQDIHLWRRMAAVGNLVAGSIDTAIAVRGVHGANRMTNQTEQARYLDYWWASLKAWFQKSPYVSKNALLVFNQAYCRYRIMNRSKWEARAAFTSYLMKHPSLLPRPGGFFDVYLLEAFGRNFLTLHTISAKNRMFGNSA